MSQLHETLDKVTAHSTAAPSVDLLMVIGFMSMLLAITFYIHHRRSRSAVVGLTLCLLATAAYGFLQGAWPIGIMQLIWAVSLIPRWRQQLLRDNGEPGRMAAVSSLTGAFAGEVVGLN